MAGSGGASNCSSGNAASNGSYSSCASGYAKPAWQTGTCVPSDGLRDLPDISLFAAAGENNSMYPICVMPWECVLANGGVTIAGVGGTSASSPAMAGIMALINQKYGPQGQADSAGSLRLFRRMRRKQSRSKRRRWDGRAGHYSGYLHVLLDGIAYLGNLGQSYTDDHCNRERAVTAQGSSLIPRTPLPSVAAPPARP